MESFKPTIEKILFNSDEEVIRSFKKHFDSNISLFIEETVRAHAKWQEFDSRIGEDEQKAYISSFIFQALNNLISSMKFLIAGYTVPSGNLLRHTIEACATAVLCSDKSLPFLGLIKRNEFSVNKATKYLKRNAAKLKINKDSVEDLKKAENFFDNYSHATPLSLTARMSFKTELAQAHWGGLFDESKVEGYRKEIDNRMYLAKNLVNLVEGIDQYLK